MYQKQKIIIACFKCSTVTVTLTLRHAVILIARLLHRLEEMNLVSGTIVERPNLKTVLHPYSKTPNFNVHVRQTPCVPPKSMLAYLTSGAAATAISLLTSSTVSSRGLPSKSRLHHMGGSNGFWPL